MALTKLNYQYNGRNFHAYAGHPAQINAQTKSLIIFPDWTGCGDFARQTAEKLVALGYIALAVDVYGDGYTSQNKADKPKLIQPLMENRQELGGRANAAYQLLLSLDQVNPHHTAAVGFCFGGLCSLDLMRNGANLKGVVSFHTLLTPNDNQMMQSDTKVLLVHGYDDPMVPPAQIDAFVQEMNRAKLDWQIHIYGQTTHGFMLPQANDPQSGNVYQAKAAQRAWLAMQNFLHEI